MAERDPRYFKVYQDGDDRELEQKIQQIVESGAAPGIDIEARDSIEEIQRKIDSGEIGGGGDIDLSDKADISYVDSMNGFNNYTTVPTFENGVLTKLEEKDGNTVVKRTTMTYNSDGSVATVRDETKDKTVVSTFLYNNGVFSSISKQLIEGGL